MELKTKLQSSQGGGAKRRKRRINVMENLVVQELEAQCSRLPEEIRLQVDLTDVEAWVLNRLPPRYVTSKRWAKSVEAQILQDQRVLLMGTVRKGIFAVYRNAQPSDIPLLPETEASTLPPIKADAWDWGRSAL